MRNMDNVKGQRVCPVISIRQEWLMDTFNVDYQISYPQSFKRKKLIDPENHRFFIEDDSRGIVVLGGSCTGDINCVSRDYGTIEIPVYLPDTLENLTTLDNIICSEGAVIGGLYSIVEFEVTLYLLTCDRSCMRYAGYSQFAELSQKSEVLEIFGTIRRR